jgi:hypothetical protein
MTRQLFKISSISNFQFDTWKHWTFLKSSDDSGLYSLSGLSCVWIFFIFWYSTKTNLSEPGSVSMIRQYEMWLRLALSKGSSRAGVPFFLPQDGNGSSFRTLVFYNIIRQTKSKNLVFIKHFLNTFLYSCVITYWIWNAAVKTVL